MSDVSETPQVVLPPGWEVAPGRETTQLLNGNQVQGVVFNLTQATTGAAVSVFVPYSLFNNTNAVAQLFLTKINGITGILSLGNG